MAAMPADASADGSPAPVNPTIAEYQVPSGFTAPSKITTGPDGALWFTETGADQIGRVDTDGNVSEFPLPYPNLKPFAITAGPDGALWFTDLYAGQGSNAAIGRITTAGVITFYRVGFTGAMSEGITTGPDGALWFTDGATSRIGRMTTSGVVTEFALPESAMGDAVEAIVVGPDGNLWFTDSAAGTLGRITTSGVVTEFSVNGGDAVPVELTVGPDGALWFTYTDEDVTEGFIGRIDPTTGTITDFALPDADEPNGHGPEPSGITTGSDGALWFTDINSNQIGRITTDGDITGYSVPTDDSAPGYITSGPDGALWFTEYTGHSIGRLSFPGEIGTPVITSAPAAAADVRTSFDFQVTTTTPTTAATLSEAGALPAGVSFADNGDGTAELAGIPAVGSDGTYPLTISAAAPGATTGRQSFTLTVSGVNSAPTLISTDHDTEVAGDAFSFTVVTNGFPAPRITKAGAFPAGVTLTDNQDGTATIAGTPAIAASGAYPVTLAAKNKFGTASQPFTLTINKAPAIKGVPATRTATVGMPFVLDFTVKGYAPPVVSAANLPAGLQLVSQTTGAYQITGTPPTGSGGQYPVALNATNQSGSTQATFTLNVYEPPVITSAAMLSVALGSAFSFPITTTGFPAPTVNESGKLPKGVTYSAKTRALSGTPAPNTAGTYNLSFVTKNKAGTSTQDFTLTVH